MKKATKKKEDPIEKLKESFKNASYTPSTGKRLGRRVVEATKPQKKG
jgi:hypothetical protein